MEQDVALGLLGHFRPVLVQEEVVGLVPCVPEEIDEDEIEFAVEVIEVVSAKEPGVIGGCNDGPDGFFCNLEGVSQALGFGRSAFISGFEFPNGLGRKCAQAQKQEQSSQGGLISHRGGFRLWGLVRPRTILAAVGKCRIFWGIIQ